MLREESKIADLKRQQREFEPELQNPTFYCRAPHVCCIFYGYGILGTDCVVYLSSNGILSTDTVLTNNPKASNGQGWCNLVEITINGFVKLL